MSRHTIQIGPRRMIYGFDRPLQHYFAQAWPESEAVPCDTIAGTAGEVIDFLDKWGVTLPDAHAAALFLDLPIGDDPCFYGDDNINIETYDDRHQQCLSESDM